MSAGLALRAGKQFLPALTKVVRNARNFRLLESADDIGTGLARQSKALTRTTGEQRRGRFGFSGYTVDPDSPGVKRVANQAREGIAKGSRRGPRTPEGRTFVGAAPPRSQLALPEGASTAGQKGLPEWQKALFAAGEVGGAYYVGDEIVSPFLDQVNGDPLTRQIEMERLQREGLLGEQLRRERFQKAIDQNAALLAQANPALTQQIVAGRRLPRGAVVIGGQGRYDMLERIAAAMSAGQFQQDTGITGAYARELGLE